MTGITFDRTSYFIDGKPAFLHSGEFHYFRVPKSDWRKRMDLFREAGGNCIATYLPWLLHEPSEGNFIFQGADYLDVEDFFRTARDAGLYVMARPGPYQYSELVYHGLPRWVYDDYPALHARRPDGKSLSRGSVSYVHPLFLEKVKRWFEAVCPLLARYTVSRGGPIAFTQFDNELMGIHLWFGGMDYNSESMGFGQPEGRYPQWLLKRYGSVAALNESYETRFQAFAEVHPLPGQQTARPADLRRKKDYFEFYLGTVADYSAILMRMMRDLGIDTPFVHNAPGPEMNALFLETVEASGAEFLLGSDHYYNLDQTWNQNNPTPQYALHVFISNEMMRLMGYPPTVFELPGGSASDWPPITSQDMQACIMANVALGMKGSNYYIFTGGPNPPQAGTNSDLYDYGAAIGADGEVRPLYDVVKNAGQFFSDHAWLARAERIHDFRVGLDFDYARAQSYGALAEGMHYSGEQAWKFVRQGVLTSAFCASLSPIFIDLRSDDWMTDLSTPLVVVCAETMARAKQERVVRFLKRGGKVLIAPVLPRFDENFFPCTLLADYLQNPVLAANEPGNQIRFNCAPLTNIFNNSGAYFTRTTSVSAEVLGVDQFSNQTIAWADSPAPGGKVIFLGFHWYHSKREHGELLTLLLEKLGLQKQVHCSNPNVWASLRRHGGQSMLFLMNLGTSRMEATAHIILPDGSTSPQIHYVLEAMTVITQDNFV